MKNIKGAAIFGQSGGPTSVINASAAGVITEALKQENITNVYGAAHGIRGMLDEVFYDMSKEDEYELELMKTTPSSELGSVRYMLKKAEDDDTDYKRLAQVFEKYNIRYFFYNGGNDSMDTCNKISKYMQKVGYDCNVIGVPKTIDNDLFGTDHCPGYGSAAKYIATSTMEVYRDARVYDTDMVTVLEIMGRNAGWLTAASALAAYKGNGPDLIYLPESTFELDKFLDDVNKKFKENKGKVIVAISEGCKNSKGEYIPEMGTKLAKDAFGHAQLGGAASILANIVKERGITSKVRGIEFSLLQRCATHCGSLTDMNEAFRAGQEAVRAAVAGETDKMVAFERAATKEYKCEYKLVDLSLTANTEKVIPQEWITENGTFVSNKFIDYALPLVQGNTPVVLEDGLPRFVNLKKVLASK